MIVSIAYVIEITTFPLILGSLTADFDLSDEAAQSLVSSYKFALVASILLAGWLGDRISREGVFAVGTALFAISSSALIFVSEDQHLLQLRVVQGIGAGLFSPMIPALLADRKPQGTLAALGYWGMLTGAAAAVYPFIAAKLTEYFHWQAGWSIVPVFALIALLGLPKARDQVSTKTTTPSTRLLGKTKLGYRVWCVLGYVFLNYGLTTWFIVAIALISGPDSYSLTTVGISLFVLWSTFSLTNLIVAKFGSYLPSAFGLSIGVLANTVAVGHVLFNPLNVPCMMAAAVLIGMGMGLNNAPTTDLAFKLTPSSVHGRIASLDIIAARLGGAVFVSLIPITGIIGVWAAAIALIASLILVQFACRKPTQQNVAKDKLPI